MKISFIAAGAFGLAIAAGPMLVAQAQAQYGGAHRASGIRHNTARPVPNKDPNCDNKLQKDNMAWMEHYHCYAPPQ